MSNTKPTVRRSIALPPDLIREVLDVAPPDLKGNLNRLVLISLQTFVAQRRRQSFADAMAEMACDPAIRLSLDLD